MLTKAAKSAKYKKDANIRHINNKLVNNPLQVNAMNNNAKRAVPNETAPYK